ncbi:MAG: UTP--glucose-1-phosphate uridylyltransferase [Patescibacteria group bacterium]|jgi:UTP--glucose-1-phosphate uridylyltransferase
MNKVRKAIIPAAGYGTRFLPATKAQPKEMLPIVDKPIIQYVVEECVASGIEDIIIVGGWHKRSIEDHFDDPYELEKKLEESGKTKELKMVRDIARMANFVYVRQKGEHYGNGVPLLNVAHLVGDEPFAVIWGDEFIHATPPRLKQCISFFEKQKNIGGVISAIRVNDDEVSRYGIAEGKEVKPGLIKIKSIIEKPQPHETPSRLAAHGAYVFTPELIDELKKVKPGKGNEIWLVDAITALAKKKDVYALEVKNATYYDTGNKLSFIKANIAFGLEHPETKKGLREYLKGLNL